MSTIAKITNGGGGGRGVGGGGRGVGGGGGVGGVDQSQTSVDPSNELTGVGDGHDDIGTTSSNEMAAAVATSADNETIDLVIGLVAIAAVVAAWYWYRSRRESERERNERHGAPRSPPGQPSSRFWRALSWLQDLWIVRFIRGVIEAVLLRMVAPYVIYVAFVLCSDIVLALAWIHSFIPVGRVIGFVLVPILSDVVYPLLCLIFSFVGWLHSLFPVVWYLLTFLEYVVTSNYFLVVVLCVVAALPPCFLLIACYQCVTGRDGLDDVATVVRAVLGAILIVFDGCFQWVRQTL